jgi:hypothetical protein
MFIGNTSVNSVRIQPHLQDDVEWNVHHRKGFRLLRGDNALHHQILRSAVLVSMVRIICGEKIANE